MMIDKFSGFDDSVDKINEDFEPEQVNLRQLLNDDFISAHSECCSSIDDILERCGEGIDLEKLDSYSMERLNQAVSGCTDFSSWPEMYSEAIQEHLMG